MSNLVVVESPAKANTIAKFLGKDFTVVSSYGHIRDLSPKAFGIDVANGFNPDYVVPEDKKNLVKDLKNATKKASSVWLATDEDREGEAIAWHLCAVLGLDPQKTKRIVFHEITKNAILEAVKKPRYIDQNLVNAQQARRILDRIVGYELSPILWKKVKPALSAGRVQSVALRLLVEREREIIAFTSTSSFRITGQYKSAHKNSAEFTAELNERITDKDEARNFLNLCSTATFTVGDIKTKPAKRFPAPPFTTSTLQQEASRKLGFSVAQTMSVAQKLYEAGKISYMRTDSVNLSATVLNASKEIITSLYGAKYSHTRQYTTKSKGAQEAHEAIRPTYMDQSSVNGTNAEKRLYELIWKRTVASQMKEAEIEKTTATVTVSGSPRQLIASGEVILFDGFLKVYAESTDDDSDENQKNMLPQLTAGESLAMLQMFAVERFTHYPPRYTEASLVRKLEELGIGRPSTYAPTISTVLNRGYAVKEDRPGTDRNFIQLTLVNQKVTEEIKSETTGNEKSKLFPTDIGMIVTDFLMNNFDDIIDYNFTASVEKTFDEIAEGQMEWTKMLSTFYKPFHKKVEDSLKNSERSRGRRELGIDPATGRPVTVLIGRFGPMVQLGDNTKDEKLQFASLLKHQYLETITLEEALELFKLPRKLGQFEGHEVTTGIGRFGPFINHKGKYYSIRKTEGEPFTITFDQAIAIIIERRELEKNKLIAEFAEKPGLKVLNGRYGPYISYEKENYKIPRAVAPESLTLDECLRIIESSGKNNHNRQSKSSSRPVNKKITRSKSKSAKKASGSKQVKSASVKKKPASVRAKKKTKK